MRTRRLAAALLILATLPVACARVTREAEGTLSRGDNAGNLHYEVFGTGRDTVVVLHGGPAGQLRYLTGMVEAVGSGFTYILYDQRGRGRSDPADSAALSLQADVADLEAVRRHFGLERVRLIGHHWGAMIAAEYGLRYPGRVDRVALVSPFPVHPSFVFVYNKLPKPDTLVHTLPPAWERVQKGQLAPESFCHSYWPWFFRPAIPLDGDVIQRLAPAVCDQPAERIRQADWIDRTVVAPTYAVGWSFWHRLDSLPAPVLVIEGNRDEPPRLNGTRWAQYADSGRVLLLDAPSAFPWVETGSEFGAALREFFHGRWPARAEDPGVYIPPKES